MYELCSNQIRCVSGGNGLYNRYFISVGVPFTVTTGFKIISGLEGAFIGGVAGLFLGGLLGGCLGLSEENKGKLALALFVPSVIYLACASYSSNPLGTTLIWQVQ